SPHSPGQDDDGIGVVATKREQVEVTEPSLERGKAGAVTTRLHLGHERRLVSAKCVNVDIVTGAAKAGCSAEWVSLGMDTERLVELDDLPFDTVALAAMTCAAHGAVRGRHSGMSRPSSTGAPLPVLSGRVSCRCSCLVTSSSAVSPVASINSSNSATCSTR